MSTAGKGRSRADANAEKPNIPAAPTKGDASKPTDPAYQDPKASDPAYQDPKASDPAYRPTGRQRSGNNPAGPTKPIGNNTSQPNDPPATSTTQPPANSNLANNSAQGAGPINNVPGGAKSARALLAARPFMLKAFRWVGNTEAGPTAEATGSILSQTLDRGILLRLGIQDAGKLTLGEVRKITPSMSSYPTIHKFCTSDGVLINDEFTGLGEYMDLSSAQVVESSASVPLLHIYYRSAAGNTGNGARTIGGLGNNGVGAIDPLTGLPTTAGNVGAGGFGTAPGGAGGTGLDGALKGNTQPDLLKEKGLLGNTATAPREVQSLIGNIAAPATNLPPTSAGTLTEGQWAVVLRNCAVFYGWVVDPKTKRVKRAPKAAFQLRTRAFEDAIPSVIPDAKKEPEKEVKQLSADELAKLVRAELDKLMPTQQTDSKMGGKEKAIDVPEIVVDDVSKPEVKLDLAAGTAGTEDGGGKTTPSTGEASAVSAAVMAATAAMPVAVPVPSIPVGTPIAAFASPASPAVTPTATAAPPATNPLPGSTPNTSAPNTAAGRDPFGAPSIPISVSEPRSNIGTTPTVGNPLGGSINPITGTSPSNTLLTGGNPGSMQPRLTTPTTGTGSLVSSGGFSNQPSSGFNTSNQINLGTSTGSSGYYGTGSTGNTTGMHNAGVPTSSQGIPNFRTNDDSKIDVAVCKHQLAVSLARNDFSSQSTEASVSGGAFGVTVGVSAGYAEAESKTSKTTTDKTTTTMIARYMFPRCDLFLVPDDLQPTPHFARLLKQIETKKKIEDLRKLQADYGQFFCQELTLGARLLSTKIMDSTMEGQEDASKESFKVSVGVSASTPYGGGSVKHEQERGKETASSTVKVTTNETNVFEASGGDTTLAADPARWSGTVANYENWRVVNRDALTPLVDMLAEIPGYAGVQSWFVQAVPAMSKYITLSPSHQFRARLRVTNPTNSLSVEDKSADYYLGFRSDDRSTPRSTPAYSVAQQFWVRMETEETKVLFSPQTYRAPVIRGFARSMVGGSMYGTVFNDDYAAVQWNLTAPFDEVLAHGSRVVLQTSPLSKPVTPGAVDTNAPPSHAVVFRNAQGMFMPGMSDHDEYQYWRILKTDSSKAGEPIKSGDSVRLSWSFKDQTTGFRDYQEDVFGRRQTVCPPELQDVSLYLKVPWPRFEGRNTPTNLILSTDSSTQQAPLTITTRNGSFTYLGQDLQLRIDALGSDGLEDADDYLLKGLVQEADKKTVTVTGTVPKKPANPMQMWARIFRFGVR